mgnify:CR=1 FL=1
MPTLAAARPLEAVHVAQRCRLADLAVTQLNELLKSKDGSVLGSKQLLLVA